MALEDIAGKVAEHKVENIIAKVMNTSGESFSDRYLQVNDIVSSLTPEERSLLVRKVGKIYGIDPYSALGFTIYGGLNELSERVLNEIKSQDENIGILATYAIRKLNLQESYDSLKNALESAKGKVIEGNLLVTLHFFNHNETLPKIGEYLGRAGNDESLFVLENMIYDLMEANQSEKISNIRKLVVNISQGYLKFEKAYQRAQERKKELEE